MGAKYRLRFNRYIVLTALWIFLFLCEQVNAKNNADPKTTGDPRIERVFLTGLSQLERGDPARAIENFLLILAQDPTLVRVRLELARAYFVSQQWDRARNEFYRVLSSDLPDPVRAAVLDYIRAIDARRGFDWDLQIGLTALGDTRRYKTDDVDLNIGGQILPFQLNRSNSNETGLRVAGTASYRKPLPGTFLGLQTVGFTSASVDIKEGRGSRYDDYVLTGRFGLRFLTDRTTASLAPVLSYRNVAGRSYEKRAGAEFGFEHRGLLGGSVFGFLSSAQIRNDRSDTLDGQESFAEIGFRRSLSGRDILGLSVYLNDRNVDDNFENTVKKGVRAFGSFTIKNGITLTPSLFFERKNYRDPSDFFVGDIDQDSYGAALKIEKSDLFIWNGFTPFVELEYSETKSGIDAFSYTEGRVEVGLDRRF